MAVFELIITLLFVGAVLAAVARRLNAPYPALLALAGVSPLMRLLKIQDDDSVEREVRLARAETARAALAAVQDTESKAELVPLLRRKYEARLQRAETGSSEASDGERGPDFNAVHRKAQAAQRRTLSDLRTNGEIGDDAFHLVEEELDWAELNAEGMERGS